MTDWKALCTELLEALCATGEAESGDFAGLIPRAHLAVTQPEPAGPTDDELDELWADIHGGGAIWAWQPYAREVLKRWGR